MEGNWLVLDIFVVRGARLECQSVRQVSPRRSLTMKPSMAWNIGARASGD